MAILRFRLITCVVLFSVGVTQQACQPWPSPAANPQTLCDPADLSGWIIDWDQRCKYPVQKHIERCSVKRDKNYTWPTSYAGYSFQAGQSSDGTYWDSATPDEMCDCDGFFPEIWMRPGDTGPLEGWIGGEALDSMRQCAGALPRDENTENMQSDAFAGFCAGQDAKACTQNMNCIPLFGRRLFAVAYLPGRTLAPQHDASWDEAGIEGCDEILSLGCMERRACSGKVVLARRLSDKTCWTFYDDCFPVSGFVRVQYGVGDDYCSSIFSNTLIPEDQMHHNGRGYCRREFSSYFSTSSHDYCGAGGGMRNLLPLSSSGVRCQKALNRGNAREVKDDGKPVVFKRLFPPSAGGENGGGNTVPEIVTY